MIARCAVQPHKYVSRVCGLMFLLVVSAAPSWASAVELTSPTPGTTLSGSSETFQWAANGTAVTEWWLYAGSTVGAKDLYDSGSLGSSTSTSVDGLPTDGRAVHVRLWYRNGSAAWQSADFLYSAAGAGAPAIDVPAQGSTLSGSSETFQWSSTTRPVTEWWLYAGSAPGRADLYDSGSLGGSLSTTVSGLPTDGSIVHVRLWYRNGSEPWQYRDYQYTAAMGADGAPAIVAPAAGASLSGRSETFQWSANNTPVTEWWLYVGSSKGRGDLYDSGSVGASLATTVSDLPIDGRTVHVRLWYRNGSETWQSSDFQYTAATRAEGAPLMNVPDPGDTLSSSTEVFKWTADGAPVNNWWLYVGSATGGKDVFDSGPLGGVSSKTVSGLPTDGRVLHVRLWYRNGGASWQYADFQYKAVTGAALPSLTAPEPSSTLARATETFQWSDNGTRVTSWWLYVGSAAGGSDLHDSGSLGGSLSTTVSGLPTDGRSLYARLWYRNGAAAWQWRDFQYTATAPVNNLSAEALQVLSPDPRIGYPLEVEVSIAAEQPTQDVSVSFFAVNTDDDPASARQYPLGTKMIELVDAGTGSYPLELSVPSSIDMPGSYFIGAIIDPVDLVAETNEADNETSVEATLAEQQFANVFIENIEPDRNVIWLDRTDYEDPDLLGVQNSDAGGTLYLAAEGADTPIEVEAFVYLRLNRSDKGDPPPDVILKHSDLGPGSYAVPLYLWESESKRYMDAYGVNTGVEEWLPVGPVEPQKIEGTENVRVNDIDRKSIHLDFYFPGRLAQTLEDALKGRVVPFGQLPPPDLTAEDIRALETFLFGISTNPDALSSEICVEIRPADPSIIDRFPEDDEFCSALEFRFTPDPVIPDPEPLPFVPRYTKPTNPGAFSTGFSSMWGGSVFGAGVDFGATTSADYRGVIAYGYGRLPVTIFGSPSEFMFGSARAQALPKYNGAPTGEEGLNIKLNFLTLPLVDLNLGYFSKTIAPDKLSFTKQKRKPRRCTADEEGEGNIGCVPEPPIIVFVGPVPVQVATFIQGSIGIEFGVNFGPEEGPTPIWNWSNVESTDQNLNLTAAPFAKLEAGASAGVGFGAFTVGIEGQLTLLQEKFITIAGATIHVVNDGFNGDPAEFVIRNGLQGINEISGADGKISLFAEYTVPSVRRCSWGFFKGYCPTIKSIKVPYDLAKWRGFLKQDRLFDRTTLIDVVRTPDGTISYYTE